MKRIFIVGMPRSGTTLLQSLLGCSPEILSFRESHLFSRIFSNRFGKIFPVIRSPYDVSKNFLEDNDWDASLSDVFLGGNQLIPKVWRNPRKVAGQLLEIIDQVAVSEGRSTWIEKTPRHLHFIDLISLSSPPDGVKFVHIVRDGGNACASLIDASRSWPRKFDVSSAVKRWKRDLRISQSYGGKSGHYLVCYDDLLQNPYEITHQLSEKLGVRILPEDFGQRQDVMTKITSQHETWKAEPQGGAITDRAHERKYLTQDQLESVHAAIHTSVLDDVRRSFGHMYIGA